MQANLEIFTKWKKRSVEETPERNYYKNPKKARKNKRKNILTTQQR